MTPDVSISDAEASRGERLRRYCEAAAAAVMGLGLLVLYGWAFDIPSLKSVLAGYAEMKANTALGMVLSGASLWMLLPSGSSALSRRMGHFLACLVTLIGAGTLGEYLFGLNLQIDQLVMSERLGAVATTSPGRMAPATSIAFLFIGVALLLLNSRTRLGQRSAQVLSLLPAVIAIVALNGYIYQARSLTKLLLYTQVALHTAIGLLLISSAIFLARPQTGITFDVTSEGPGGVMARRSLPAIFLIPLLLDWIRLKGQYAGLYGTEFGLALNASSTIVVFAILVWFSARKMNEEYDQRSKAEFAIRELNADLERRVAQRTASLAEQATVLAEQAELLDLTHDSIFVRDWNDRITFWNHGAIQMYGWSVEQALGRVKHELLRTRCPVPMEEIQARLLAGDYWEGELVHTRADQSSIVVASRWVLQRDDEGEPRGVLEINNDITERKRAEDALRLSEERLALLIQGGKNHAIFMVDPAGLVVTWNEGAQRLNGYASTEIIGQHFSKFFPSEAIAQGKPTETLRVAREQGHSEDESWRVRKDGSCFWANVVTTALRDKTGKLQGFGKVTRDFTDRKQADLMLEETRQEQLRFKDEFLSHVSHELRSPLAAIDSFSSIIADGLAGGTTAQQDEYLEIILRNTAQLQSMVDDLLEVTRAISGKLRVDLERVSLPRALLDVLHTLQGAAAAKGVEFTSNSDTSLPQAHADPIRLLQVLIILCDNAIKFTSTGGAVKIEASIFDKDPRFLLVQVSDSGCGICPESIERIFDHHFQVSDFGSSGRRGLGLGLYIAKELVSRQGGEIWVSSEPQHGSTFSFSLPLFATPAAEAVAALPPGLNKGNYIVDESIKRAHDGVSCERPLQLRKTLGALRAVFSV